MDKNTLIHAAIRIFGVWILIQALSELVHCFAATTTCLFYFDTLMDLLRHRGHGQDIASANSLDAATAEITRAGAKATLQTLVHSLIHTIGYAILAVYLLRGAPHLVRFMKLEKTEN